MKTINPATGEVIEEYAVLSKAEVLSRLNRASNAQLNWTETSFAERSHFTRNLASALLQQKEEAARMMALEMGKPLEEGRSEIEKCAWLCTHYAEHAQEYLKPEVHSYDNLNAQVVCEPLGVILAIMPWNFPFWQVVRCAVPAILAGNTVVLKHAPNVLGCAVMIEEMIQSAGFPKDVFQNFIIEVNQVEDIIEHPSVRGVSLTGSERAGRSVAKLAGKHLIKSVLELGGNDAYLVLEDADLQTAVDATIASRLRNNGQSCIGAKRCIVHTSLYEEFIDSVEEKMKALQYGDPLDDKTDLGPIARQDLRDHLHDQVQASIRAGAQCVMGGNVPDTNGWFYEPTVLKDVKPGMPAFDEELFGPVVSILPFETEEEGIELANQSTYGLGAAVFSADENRAMHIAQHRLKAGSVAVNGFVRSDPRLPFGGVKNSGYGRELGKAGIQEFVNLKTITTG